MHARSSCSSSSFCLLQRDWPRHSATVDGFIRGIYWGMGALGTAFFAALGSGVDTRGALILAGGAFFLALSGRTMEGKLDERKAVIGSP